MEKGQLLVAARAHLRRLLRFRIKGTGFRIQGLGFRILDLGFGILDLGFRVYALGPGRV